MKSKKTFSKPSFYFRAYKYRYRKDRDEIQFIVDSVKPGFTALDIGAHKGAYTYWLQKSVGSMGKVIAFEPQPILYDYLTECVKSLHWDNVVVENCALSSNAGEMSLYVPFGGPSPGATLDTAIGKNFDTQYIVRVDSLDDYKVTHGIKKVDFIKCDVEGHELEVFEGAESILSTDSPILMFECEQRHNKNRPLNMIFDYLVSRGYRGFFYLDRKFKNVEEFDIERYQVLNRKPYINNFIFIKE